jgi:endonuclease YncB( thermonuclease family)
MRLLVLLALCFAVAPAHAQIFTGMAATIDGDSLKIGDEQIRLFGIDAPEALQTCDRGGETWHCGRDASAALAALADRKPISCEARDRDVYGRTVATCLVDGADIGRAMLAQGMAIALPAAPPEYLDREARAKSLRVGLWGSAFDLPEAYRRANPRMVPVAVRRPRHGSASLAPARSARQVMYRNCAEARAAGAAPMYVGQPGYSAHLDRDGDGIACEPYRGR